MLFLAAALLASPTLRKSLVADGLPTLPGAAVCLHDTLFSSPTAVSCKLGHTQPPSLPPPKCVLSLLGAVALQVASALVEPPPRYPDIHAVAISMYSFLHFAGFYAFFSVEQFRPGAAAPASAGAKKKPE